MDDKETKYICDFLREHFCDLFAAQYLGSVIGANLNFVAEDYNYLPQHPSTQRRISIIESFLNGSGTANDILIIDILKEATKTQTKRSGKETELIFGRNKPLSTDPFNVKRAIKLKEKAEVHSLIIKGWEYFMTSGNSLEPIQRMNHVNKIIRSSLELTLMGGRYYSPKMMLSRWLV